MPSSSFLGVLNEETEAGGRRGLESQAREEEEMRCFLDDLFEVRRLGGRVRSVGGGQFIVTDVVHYSHDMWLELRVRFPLARVDIEACTNSLGGFMVRVRTTSSSVRPYVFASVLVAVLAALLVFNLDASPWALQMLRG